MFRTHDGVSRWWQTGFVAETTVSVRGPDDWHAVANGPRNGTGRRENRYVRAMPTAAFGRCKNLYTRHGTVFGYTFFFFFSGASNFLFRRRSIVMSTSAYTSLAWVFVQRYHLYGHYETVTRHARTRNLGLKTSILKEPNIYIRKTCINIVLS